MLINGVILAFLVVTNQLSGKNKEKGKGVINFGFVVFAIFFVIVNLLYILGRIQLLNQVIWFGTILTSLALLIKLYQIIREKRGESPKIKDLK